MNHSLMIRLGLAGLLLAALLLPSATVQSDTVYFAGSPPSIAQDPLYLKDAVPPLNMLVMGKDHKLYYEAYNDASDLNGDGTLDVGYRGWELKNPAPDDGSSPYEIDYFGLFGSYLCYEYSGGRFVPVSATDDKTCSGQWSGDFLNYLTTSRMDALRRVLYGGDRIVDSADETVLERTYIPQDAHSWGKEYESVSRDEYDIADYTPYNAPSSGRHLFASTSLRDDSDTPLLRVLPSSQYRIWEWVSIERPVAGARCEHGGNGPLCGAITDFTVRVVACPPGQPDLHDSTCKLYPADTVKPTGILHDYGEDDSMYFGMITGSQFNNLQGGVLRRNIRSFREEVDPNTGMFIDGADGIVRTLSRLRMVGFGGNYEWTRAGQNCPALGWRALRNGECRMWGNPVAEMMYEAVRYFAGAPAATPLYAAGGSSIGRSEETAMGLPTPDWQDPYRSTAEGGYPTCAKPNMTVISDINPSYDSELPGNAFGATEPDGATPASIAGFAAAAEGARIWGHEALGTRNIFIGQSGAVADGAPTAKEASSFGNIRGLAPEEPTKEGSYYSASVASYGLRTDVSAAGEDQNVSTYAVAVASPLPKIVFPIGDRTITLVPFAKSIAHPPRGPGDDFRIPQGVNDFRPTNTIVDFYVEEIVNLPGAPSTPDGIPKAVFRINYEDVEQGNDHDMDVIVRYELTAAPGGNLDVKLTSEYEAGSVMHHVGYVISGTTQDGTYLEVRDADGNSTNPAATRYKLDTPPGTWAGDCDTADPLATCPRLGNNTLLPLETTRRFAPGTSGDAELLKDPLWYAAKYGGYVDANGNGLPDAGEWEKENPDPDLLPDQPKNYFLVTNPLQLREQLSEAFDEISDPDLDFDVTAISGARVGSSSFSLVPSFDRGENDRVGKDWTGNLTAFAINQNGTQGDLLWNAQDGLPAHGSRNIRTIIDPGDGTDSRQSREFVHNRLGPGGTPARLARLGILGSVTAAYGDNYSLKDLVDYMRGDQSNELSSGGTLRDRSSVLGDIVNSEPVVVSPRSNYGYGYYNDDMFDGYIGAGGYLEDKSDRPTMAYVGANDGMLHAFDASTQPCGDDDTQTCAAPGAGEELFAFVPHGVLNQMGRLALPDDSFNHRYYVDGQITVSDAKQDPDDDNSWKTLLIGSTGAGGRSVFALDVSNPDGFNNGDVLWERNAVVDLDIGHVYGKPLLVPLENGAWGVLFGNGYGGNLSDPSLYILDAFTGEVIRKITAVDDNPAEEPGLLDIVGGLIDGLICSIETLVGGECARATDPFNGLGQITAIDEGGNGKVDVVYGGDLQGNLWKFDLGDEDASVWGVANDGGALFVAEVDGERQPITGGIRVSAGPGTGVMVFFGTGRYFVTGDNDVPDDPQIQSLYGVFDNESAVAEGRLDLVEQTITSQISPGGFITRQISFNGVAYYGADPKRGWYLDLKLAASADGVGERFIATPLISSGRIFFTTYTPLQDSCNPGGTNFQYGLDLLSGAGALTNVGVLPGEEAACTGEGCEGTGAVALGGTDGSVLSPVMSSSDAAINPLQLVDATCDPTAESCATFTECKVVIYPGGFVLPRPCGRQSWRQLK